MWGAPWAKADLATLAAENISQLNQRPRQKKKSKNDSCPFECELTARPPGRDAASLSEPLGALDSVNHAAALWCFRGADRRPPSQVAAQWISGGKIESRWPRWQAEGGPAEKKKRSWLSEKFQRLFDGNSAGEGCDLCFLRLRHSSVFPPICSSCYS